MTLTSTRVLYVGTVEYLDLVVTADVDLDQDVEITFDRETWIPAAWAGDVGTTRTAQVLLGDAVPLPAKGAHKVYLRFTDNPEIPVVLAGTVVVR